MKIDNYKIISAYTNHISRDYYQMIEKDLIEIINAPSTINSIIKYYNVAHDERGCHYLIFNKKIIIREYGTAEDWWNRKMQMELWCDMSLRNIIYEPVLIAPPSVLK